ncbi:MAG: hypothetical protein JW902_16620 [Syntrophaceae bacterium]|nr:hypothetical protein [Syntrophaceae bacterium]
MTDLNENHKRRLLIGFYYMNDLLSEMERILAVDQDRQAVFPKYVPDVTFTQQKDIAITIELIRDEMHRILRDKDIPIRPADISAIKAVSNIVHFLDMAGEEMRPKYMRGYGALTVDASSELDEIVSIMKRMHGRILKSII